MNHNKRLPMRRYLVPTDETQSQSLKNYGSETEGVRVVFDDIAAALIKEICRASYVVGCVAWLTNRTVLEALASKSGASIIVQKEDFLRPDSNGPDKDDLHRRYSQIKPIEGADLPGLLGSLSVLSSPVFGIRCCGTAGRQKVQPRMHHKFAVFLDRNLVPYRVWTGSYNWTNNAEVSFENAVLLDQEVIVQSFLNEYQQIAALSEPLDWTSEYVEPEYRIGT